MTGVRRIVALGGAALAAAATAAVLVLSLGGAGGTAGAGGGQTGAAALEGAEWTLVSLKGASLTAGSPVTARFSGGQLSGSAPVNRYFASYTLDGGRLTIEEIGATKMAGPEPLMQDEQAFFDALASATSFSRSGQTLTIATTAGDLVFTAR